MRRTPRPEKKQKILDALEMRFRRNGKRWWSTNDVCKLTNYAYSTKMIALMDEMVSDGSLIVTVHSFASGVTGYCKMYSSQPDNRGQLKLWS